MRGRKHFLNKLMRSTPPTQTLARRTYALLGMPLSVAHFVRVVARQSRRPLLHLPTPLSLIMAAPSLVVSQKSNLPLSTHCTAYTIADAMIGGPEGARGGDDEGLIDRDKVRQCALKEGREEGGGKEARCEASEPGFEPHRMTGRMQRAPMHLQK